MQRINRRNKRRYQQKEGVVSGQRATSFKQGRVPLQHSSHVAALPSHRVVAGTRLLQVVEQFPLVHQHVRQRVVERGKAEGLKQLGKLLLGGHLCETTKKNSAARAIGQ